MDYAAGNNRGKKKEEDFDGLRGPLGQYV